MSGPTTTADLEQLFDATIAHEQRVEPRDWMPRATARRSSGRSPSTRTPRSSACSRGQLDHARRRRCAARRSWWPRCRTRPGHGLYLYSAAETLGADRDELLDLLHKGRQKYSTIFNYPT
jgi:ring-1,2-phenylacetyl-CoA epoxidase subunit PaaA